MISPNKLLASMTKKSKDFIFQTVTFSISLITVHTFYLLVVSPISNREVEYAEAQNQALSRTFFVIIKDYEQELCFVLLFWAMFIIFRKILDTTKFSHLLEVQLVSLNNDNHLTKENMEVTILSLQKLQGEMKSSAVVQCLIAGLERYLTTESIQYTSEAISEKASSFAMRMEAELSMVRYIIWAIPSIGFIGTVRGIGDALSQAHLALKGDIAGMTASLGVAFNSTFTALVISIFLMFILHQLQLIQDRYILDTEEYCNKKIIEKLHKR
jgi:biopolymer transport protein ExbB/TolQ